MNKNVALVLGLLVVVAFTGWQLLGGGDDAAAPTGLTLEPQAAEPDVPAVTSLAAADATSPSDPAGAQREAVDAAPARPAAEAGDLVVRVIDESEAPLADVEVLVFVTGEDEAISAFLDPVRVDELLEREGHAAYSDAEGLLHLAKSPEETSLLLLGRKDGWWGTLRLRHGRQDDPDLPALVLRPDRTVRARVVDESGRALEGHRVSIEMAQEYWSNPVVGARTQADGIATFPHVQHVLTEDRLDDEGRLVIQLDVLAPTPIREPLEEEDYDGPPVVLVAPATGSVEVRVFTFEQQPFQGKVRTSLTQVPEGSPRVPSPFSNERRSHRSIQTEVGVARYEFVALGMELDGAATRPGCSVQAHAYVPGPVRAGENVTLDVRFGASQPIVQLRLLDESGEVLADQTLTVEVRTYGGYLPGNLQCFPKTDGEGVLRLDLRNENTEDVTRSILVKLRGDGAGDVSAQVELPKVLETGLNDLGDVKLGRGPLFVAGRVRDAAGAPMADAKLVLDHREEGRNGWRQRGRFEARSDAAGAFELRGIEPPGAYRIAATADGYASTYVEFTPGARDVVLELAPEATISGRLLVDEGIDVQGLRLRLSGGPAGERLEYRQSMPAIGEDGSFTFRGLHPGGGRTVHLQFDDVWADLEVFPDVTAVVGDAAQDPRLNPIDLRGQLHAHEIVVTGVGEGVALEGSLVYGPAGAEELEFQRWVNDRSFTVLSATPRIDLVGSFDGFRQVELSAVGERATLELRPAIEVTLVLAGDVALPEPPVFLKPALAPAADENFDVDVGGDPFDDLRAARVHAPADGRMRVCWIAERRSEQSSIAGEVQLDRKQYIDVADGIEGQRFEVELTAEEMQKIRDRFD